MRRGLLVLAGLVGVGIAAGTAYDRWVANERDRLDVYFDDGSFVTFEAGSTEAARLLPLARRVLLAAAGNASGQAAGVRPEDRAAEGGPGRAT